MSNRSKKFTNKRSKRNGKRGSARSERLFPLTRVNVRSSPTDLMPAEQDSTLTFVRRFTLSGASAAVAQGWISNTVYRPEPGFSTSAGGYAEWAAFYAFFRVIGYSYQLSASNLESFPVTVFVCNTNQQMSVSSTVGDQADKKTQARELSAKGGQDRTMIRKGYRIVDIVGSDTVEVDDDYRGSTQTPSDPGDLTWLTVGAQSFSANLSTGVSCVLKIRYRVRWYDRNQISQGSTFKVVPPKRGLGTTVDGVKVLFLGSKDEATESE